MRISFSMDGVKNMDELYTYTVEKDRWGEDIATEHYCGDDYCEKIVKSVWDSLSAADWKHYEYIGSRDRIANETFILTAADDSQYQVSFAINTYRGKAARLEITLVAMETDTYHSSIPPYKFCRTAPTVGLSTLYCNQGSSGRMSSCFFAMPPALREASDFRCKDR